MLFGYLFLVKPSKQDKQCDAAEEQENTDNKALRQEGQFQVMGATWDRHTDKAVLKGGDWNFFAVKRSSPALVIRDGRYKLLLFFSRDIVLGTAFADRHSDPSILDRINCLLVGVGIQGDDLRVLE